MHKIRLSYEFVTANDPRISVDGVHHPLTQLLRAISEQGSIRGAASYLGLSYRHVWGELKRWEETLGHTLILWNKGQSARLSDMGFKLMWAERHAQAQLAPQIQALRADIERSFATALNAETPVVKLYASHDDAVRNLQQFAPESGVYLDVRFCGSVDAIRALNEGRCQLAGFHVPIVSAPESVIAKTYKPMLKPGLHKVIGFARRQLGLIVPSGNPSNLKTAACIKARQARFAMRALGTGTRVSLNHWLVESGIALDELRVLPGDELSHQAVALRVASGDADVGMGTESAALALGLTFVPLFDEAYLFVCLKSYLESPAMQALRTFLKTDIWVQYVDNTPGYKVDRMGEVMALSAELPWWSFRKKAT